MGIVPKGVVNCVAQDVSTTTRGILWSMDQNIDMDRAIYIDGRQYSVIPDIVLVIATAF